MSSGENKNKTFIAQNPFFIVSVLSGLWEHKQAVTKAVIRSQQITTILNTRWHLQNNIAASPNNHKSLATFFERNKGHSTLSVVLY